MLITAVMVSFTTNVFRSAQLVSLNVLSSFAAGELRQPTSVIDFDEYVKGWVEMYRTRVGGGIVIVL